MDGTSVSLLFQKAWMIASTPQRSLETKRADSHGCKPRLAVKRQREAGKGSERACSVRRHDDTPTRLRRASVPPADRLQAASSRTRYRRFGRSDAPWGAERMAARCKVGGKRSGSASNTRRDPDDVERSKGLMG